MILFNVTGDMSETGASYPTQDIEFNSTPAVDLADAKTTREITGLRIKYASDQKELYKHLENGQTPNCRRCQRRAEHAPGEYAAAQPDSLPL